MFVIDAVIDTRVCLDQLALAPSFRPVNIVPIFSALPSDASYGLGSKASKREEVPDLSHRDCLDFGKGFKFKYRCLAHKETPVPLRHCLKLISFQLLGLSLALSPLCGQEW